MTVPVEGAGTKGNRTFIDDVNRASWFCGVDPDADHCSGIHQCLVRLRPIVEFDIVAVFNHVVGDAGGIRPIVLVDTVELVIPGKTVITAVVIPGAVGTDVVNECGYLGITPAANILKRRYS